MVLLQVNLVIRHNLAHHNHQAKLLRRGNLVALISRVNLCTRFIQLSRALLISSPFDPKAVITLKVNIDQYTMRLKVLLITLNCQAILIFRSKILKLLNRDPHILRISILVFNLCILVLSHRISQNI